MKMTSRNIGQHARNRGQGKRTTPIVQKEMEKSKKKTENSHLVDSKDLKLFQRVETRPCSCLKSVSKNGEFEENDPMEISIINLDEDDAQDMAVDEALEFLDQQKESCSICFGTGQIGGFKLINTYEWYFEPTDYYALNNVTVLKDKPYAFKPDDADAYVIFQAAIPLYWDSMDLVSITPDGRQTVTAQWSTDDITYIDFTDDMNGAMYIKIPITEEVKGFMLRVTMGSPYVKVNFPFIDLALLSGEFDYWDTVSVSIGPEETISTKDVLIDETESVWWRVTNVAPKTSQGIDMGKDATLRKCKVYEVYTLLT